MIARLIRWSASNLTLILIGSVLATGLGLYAVRHVPLDAILNEHGIVWPV